MLKQVRIIALWSLLVVTGLGSVTPALAVAVDWDGLAAGNWGTATNWSGNVLPGAADDVLIDGGDAQNTTVTLNVNPSINSLTVDTGDALSFNNGTSLTVGAGGISNSGQISLNATSAFTILNIQGGTTIGGSGEVVFTDSTFNRLAVTGGGTITNAAGHTLRGAGTLLANSAKAATGGMPNQGTIRATGVNALIIKPDASNFTNQGTLRAEGSGGIDLNGGGGGVFSNTGTVIVDAGSRIDLVSGAVYTQTAGTTLMNGALTTGGTTLNINGGVLGGNGTITGNVSVTTGGVVNPGNSPGLLKITGNYTQSATGELEIELAGFSRGMQYDALDVTGNVTINGLVDLHVNPAFAVLLNVGDLFKILDYTGTRTGSFASLVDDTTLADFELRYSLGIDPTAVFVEVTAIHEQVVPEPSTYLLLASGLAGLVVYRRWKGRRARSLSS